MKAPAGPSRPPLSPSTVSRPKLQGQKERHPPPLSPAPLCPPEVKGEQGNTMASLPPRGRAESGGPLISISLRFSTLGDPGVGGAP